MPQEILFNVGCQQRHSFHIPQHFKYLTYKRCGINLKSAFRSNIRTLMITGDNLLTATSVGRECGIVDKSRDLFQLDLDMRAKDNFSLVVKEMASDSTQNKMSSCPLDEFDSEMGNRDSYLQQFAMTGNTFSAILEQFPPNQIDRMIANCKIFARMAPNHKQILVNRLKQMGNTVAMCGDGTNDSAALKVW